MDAALDAATTTTSTDRWHGPAGAMLAYDIHESEDAYQLTFDVPGVSSDDVNVEITGNQLVVTADRKPDGPSRGPRYGRFQRSFLLPEGITAEAVVARCRDGVLRLDIHKPASVKPIKIKINSDESTKPGGGFFKQLISDKRDNVAVNN
jgi:HSP20 family protein